AVLLVAIASFDLFLPSLTPRFEEAAPISLRVPLARRVEASAGEPLEAPSVGTEQIVVARGTVLSEEVDEHRVAVAYERSRRPPQPVAMAALGVLYGLVMFLLATYLRRYGH